MRLPFVPRLSTNFSCALLGWVLASTASADTIVLRSGDEIEARVIVSEGLKEITYRDKGNKNQVVATADVARVEYDKKPELLSEAELSLAEGDVGQAIYELDLYVSGFLEGNADAAKLQPWAPAWAAARVVELQQSQEAYAAAIQAADRVITSFGDTRYLPEAWMAKARAQYRTGSEADALGSLKAFEAQIESLGLSDVWKRRVELAKIEFDGGIEPAKRLERLSKLEEATDALPDVQESVRLALGEAHLVMADIEQQKRAEHLDAAEGWFESVLEGASDAGNASAGALTGLGDVLYLRASPDKDVEGLKAARMQYMRVVVLHSEQGEYAPRAMYFAALASKAIYSANQDPQELERQRKLALRLRARYRTSKWADDARALSK